MLMLGAAAMPCTTSRRGRCLAARAATTTLAPPVEPVGPAEPADLDALLDFTPRLKPHQAAVTVCVGVATTGSLLAVRPRERATTPAPEQLACGLAGLATALLCRYLLQETNWSASRRTPESVSDRDSRWHTSANGLVVHYKQCTPPGRPRAAMACLHGFGANTGSWTEASALSALSARLGAVAVAPDAPGFGLTSRSAKVEDYSMESSAACSWEILQRAASALPADAPLIVAGHSLGGLTAVRLAAAADRLSARRVSALVLVAPAIPAPQAGAALAQLDAEHQSSSLDGKRTRSAAFASLLLRILTPFPLLPFLRAAVRNKKFWLKGLASARGDGGAVPPRLLTAYRRPSLVRDWDVGMLRFVAARLVVGDVRAPSAASELARLASSGTRVLIVHGDRDRLVPLSNSRRLAETLPGSRLVVFEGCGHCPQEEEGERFAEVVGAWLDEV